MAASLRTNIRILDPAGGNPGQVPMINPAGTKLVFGDAGLSAEQIRDLIGSTLVQGSGVTIAVNDAGDTITISANLDAEVVRDTIGSALVQGSGINIAVDDTANTITISATLDAEVVRDTIGDALVEGDGVTIVVDDAANTVTISAPARPQLVPLTTVVGGEPSLVWDEANNLVMTTEGS